MTIQKTINDTTLEMHIAGRIDTTTAPQMEAELKESLPGVTELRLDFSEVEYISSAGLRVLLSTHKRMNVQGKMSISNVSEDVMEVFDITGFADILTIL